MSERATFAHSVPATTSRETKLRPTSKGEASFKSRTTTTGAGCTGEAMMVERNEIESVRRAVGKRMV